MKHESEIIGYAIHASDGLIGTVSDCLFDDATWLIRWFVVDTSSWLPGRKVLLPPSVLGHVNHIGHEFTVRLTKQQVKASPDVDTDLPVSRQIETDIYDYYGWNPYWTTDFYTGGYSYSGDDAMEARRAVRAIKRSADDVARVDRNDPYLRSVREITGYHISARDGEIGHIGDILVEDADWSIHYLVIDTKNWWPGKKVIISPRSVKAIDWLDKQVKLNIDRKHVKDSPPYDSSATIDRVYENQFHRYYGASDVERRA